jgi:tRNA(fMet)-specific endonuclease VapC
MKVLDTDTLTLFMQGQPKVLQRRMQETEEVVISVMTRIEVLQGRFASLAKAANGEELKRGQHRLDQAERDLQAFRILPIISAVAVEFDRLRQLKRLKKIGRGDLLIAAIVLANRATLVTRNVRDFRTVPGLQIENWAA